jgi:hypothetical protein
MRPAWRADSRVSAARMRCAEFLAPTADYFPHPTCCTLDSGSRARSPRWGAVGTMARLPGPSAALRPVPAPRAVLRRPPPTACRRHAVVLSPLGSDRPTQRARRQSHRTRRAPDSIIELRDAAVTLPSAQAARRPAVPGEVSVPRGSPRGRNHEPYAKTPTPPKADGRCVPFLRSHRAIGNST